MVKTNIKENGLLAESRSRCAVGQAPSPDEVSFDAEELIHDRLRHVASRVTAKLRKPLEAEDHKRCPDQGADTCPASRIDV